MIIYNVGIVGAGGRGKLMMCKVDKVVQGVAPHLWCGSAWQERKQSTQQDRKQEQNEKEKEKSKCWGDLLPKSVQMVCHFVVRMISFQGAQITLWESTRLVLENLFE